MSFLLVCTLGNICHCVDMHINRLWQLLVISDHDTFLYMHIRTLFRFVRSFQVFILKNVTEFHYNKDDFGNLIPFSHL